MGVGGDVSVLLPQQQQSGAGAPLPATMIVPSQQGYCVYFQPHVQAQSQGVVELPTQLQQLWTRVKLSEGRAELK